MSKTLSRSIWLFILTLALLVRVGVGIYWNSIVEKSANQSTNPPSVSKDGPFFYGDSDSYWKLARTIAFGRPYEFDETRRWQIFRTPGYPAILAPLFWIYGETPPTFAARMEGAIFGTINVVLVGWLALTIFGKSDRGRLIALLASLFVALDPTEALQSVSILSEEPFMTFSLLLNVEFVKTARRFGILPSSKTIPEDDKTPNALSSNDSLFPHSIKLAFFNAAAIYLRPSWYYFLPFASCFVLLVYVLSLLVRRRAEKLPSYAKRGLLKLGLCVVFAHLFTVALLLPWALRNYRISGKLVITTLQMGASLYDGLNPDATGASEMSFVDRFRQDELNEPSDSEEVHFEVRLDKRMKSAAIEWANSHKFKVLKLACIKFYRLWSPTPREQSFSSPFLKFILFVSYAPILIFGLLGLLRTVRQHDAAYFLVVPPLYISLLHIVFVSSIRYRVPVMYCFSILASYLLASVVIKVVPEITRQMSTSLAWAHGSRNKNA